MRDDVDYEIQNALDEIDNQPPGRVVSEDVQFKKKINNALHNTSTKRKRSGRGGKKSRRRRGKKKRRTVTRISRVRRIPKRLRMRSRKCVVRKH